MLAYLVIREGSKWSDVFRLVPGAAITIGRAPTNQIVLKDERCSRCHAELFLSQGQWILRDLESRNGTAVNEFPVRGDHPLEPGEVIRIGQSQLAFVHDLSKAFAEPAASRLRPPENDETVIGSVTDSLELDDPQVLASDDAPATITHRRGQTRFLRPSGDDEQPPIPKVGKAATSLCRLAFELAKASDTASLAREALTGLFTSLRVDGGAVLSLPRDKKKDPSTATLEILSSRTKTNLPYSRLSTFVATTVLRDGEAVLARNVMGDSTLGTRDSHGVVHATSVICAPIRFAGAPLGLVHLYSTDPDVLLDPDDLEYTLAVAETLGVALDNLGRRQELAENYTRVRDENLQLRERLGAQSEIVGSSPQMAAVGQEIARAAPSRATVLVRGESGVGKELVARAVHYSSPRRKGPFVCLNCAALSRSLLASELFGHEQGAFTGATQRKLGKFEAAHLGTLMLDEIGEMSPAIQAKFLRVLEGHPFERVGGTNTVKVDVRVIAATNRDLEKDVAEGRFRRDLYFRLRVIEIFVPALRKRPDDIAILADYFLAKFNDETGRKLRGFTDRALERMQEYRWPGNVRELKNVVERAVVLSRGDYLDADDLTLTQLATAGDSHDAPPSPPSAPAAPAAPTFQPSSLADMERAHILATLIATGWNKSQTAQQLGIERSTLDRKIRRYEITEEPRRA